MLSWSKVDIALIWPNGKKDVKVVVCMSSIEPHRSVWTNTDNTRSCDVTNITTRSLVNLKLMTASSAITLNIKVQQLKFRFGGARLHGVSTVWSIS